MRGLFVAMCLLLATISSATVFDDTDHWADANTVSTGMSNAGYPCGVGIISGDYYVVFNGYFDYAKIGAAVAAIATVSEATSWTSYKLIIGFSQEARAYYITTANCRYIMELFNAGYSEAYIATELNDRLFWQDM